MNRTPQSGSQEQTLQTFPGGSPERTVALRSAFWLALAIVGAWAGGPRPALAAGPGTSGEIGPVAVIAVKSPSPAIYVAGGLSRELLTVDPEQGAVVGRMPLPGEPSGLALAADRNRLWVTCAAPRSTVVLLDPALGMVLRTFTAGHTAMAPVPTPDGRQLLVCERFDHTVAVYDLPADRVVERIPVPGEPVAAAVTPDGARVFVANHLHAGRADADVVAAGVSVIDVASRRVIRELPLPHGSGLLLGVAVSPDGRHVAVTHNLARPNLPTTQVDRGWMNTAALTLVDATELKVLNTVLLDGVDHGAANPWAVAWTADGGRLLVTHAGTHELSVIDARGLLARLASLPVGRPPAAGGDAYRATTAAADVPNDLAFLVGLRERLRLSGNGPRSLAVVEDRVWVGGHFSDSLERVDLGAALLRPTLFALGPRREPSLVRRGEMLFNDASLCFQQWQSCASCHSFDARVDALNWDLLNDGVGNPKNNKSLLWSHRTPPVMSGGVRESAEQAVRAGIRHILFTVQPDSVALAMDAYLASLEPAPSPRLVDGELSAAAQRGKALFEDTEVGCAACHPPGLFTDLNPYDVGTRGVFDEAGVFDTPTLVELWRTAPYLHDGSAVTVQEVLTTANRGDRHGRTSHLKPSQIDDLVDYILSQ